MNASKASGMTRRNVPGMQWNIADNRKSLFLFQSCVSQNSTPVCVNIMQIITPGKIMRHYSLLKSKNS